jgi:copper chaperone
MQFQIDAMHCGGCARGVTKAIHSVDLQAKIDVDLTMKRVTVVSDTDESAIAARLKVAGYPARPSASP